MYCFFYQDLQVLNYQCLAFADGNLGGPPLAPAAVGPPGGGAAAVVPPGAAAAGCSWVVWAPLSRFSLCNSAVPIKLCGRYSTAPLTPVQNLKLN